MMTETFTFDLSKSFLFFPVLTAEWWDEKSKFVVVRGCINSPNMAAKHFALRLDLEKRAFLDHASNAETDALVQKQASEISRLVWNERLKRQQKSGNSFSAA